MVEAKKVKVNLKDSELGTAELRTNAYLFQWPTTGRDEEVLDAMRKFIGAVGERTDILLSRKFFRDGVIVFNKEGEGSGDPLVDFLHADLFARKVRERQSVAMRVNTGYVDICYDLEARGGQRSVYVMSHADLSDQLAGFVVQTHQRGLSETDTPMVSAVLSEALAQYR